MGSNNLVMSGTESETESAMAIAFTVCVCCVFRSVFQTSSAANVALTTFDMSDSSVSFVYCTKMYQLLDTYVYHTCTQTLYLYVRFHRNIIALNTLIIFLNFRPLILLIN